MQSGAFGAAALVGLAMLSPAPAAARFPVSTIAAPSLIEDVVCTVRKVRTIRSGGRVVVRTARTCTPSRAPNRTVRISVPRQPASRRIVPPAAEPSLVCQDVQISTVRSKGVVIRTVRNCN
jgi:hypothetical protein